MNQKPKEIIEIENLLGIEMQEANNEDEIIGYKSINSFLLNEKREIIGLNLCNNKIQSISFLKKFTNLQALDFSNNQVEDISALTELLYLQVLRFDKNEVRDISSLKKLTQLQALWFDNNKVTDISVLKHLTNLIILFFSHNRVQSGISPLMFLTNIKQLAIKNLYLGYGYGMTDISPLQYLKNLEWLDISSNNIAYSDMSFIRNFTKLSYLDFSRNYEIKDISPITDLANLNYLDFSYNQIKDISPIRNLTNLIHLDFSNNQIKDISPIEKLTNLKHLDFSSNQIKDISPIGKLTNLKHLSFMMNPITNIDILENFTNLNYLRVPREVTLIPESILWYISQNVNKHSKIIQIESILDIEITHEEKKQDYNERKTRRFFNNGVQTMVSISEGITWQSNRNTYFTDEMGNITRLNLRKNKIINIGFLKLITTLQYLDIYGNEITDISPLECLDNLIQLDIRVNQVQDIAPIRNLINLQRLDFDCNNVENISCIENLINLEFLSFSDNKVNNISPLKGLIHLKVLDISRNFVRTDEFYKMANSGNYDNELDELLFLKSIRICDISALQNLYSLENINISLNHIKDISVLQDLVNLKEIAANHNYIQNISYRFIQGLPNLCYLSIYNNPVINVPVETLNRGLPALQAYFQDLEKGGYPNNEVKIVLIGNGSVGKTQIAKRLIHVKIQTENTKKNGFWEKMHASLRKFFAPKFRIEKKHQSTHAIDLHRKKLPCDFLQEGLDLNIWDFGGQDIYHATHHLFMQTRALFILVWDAENEKEDSQHEYKGVKYDNFPLRYWLEYAKYFGKESPILVVRNKTDIHGKEFEMPKGVKESYQTEYPNIVGFVEVSAKTGDNFYGLEKQIQKAFEDNENLRNDLINKQLPTAWVRMRNKIREEQQKEGGLQQISKEIFQEWCEKELIPDSAPTLLYFFHQTGVFFYDEKHFSGQIILDQSWAISAVYKVLDKDATYFSYLQEQQGKLNYGDICEIWQEYTDVQRELFLGFMLSCELCFETTENKKYDKTLKDRTFVVPQLLHKEMNFALKNALPTLSLTEKETKKFAFLPTSLIQRFIIKAHSLAKIEDIWQKGILLHYENAFALAEAFYGREPYLQIQYNKEAKISLVPAIWAEFDKLEGKEKAKPLQGRDFMENAYWQGLDSLIVPNKKDLKQEIQMLIADSKISEAIKALLTHFEEDKENKNYILAQSQRFNHIEIEKQEGILSNSEYVLERNKITKALLQVF